MNVTINANFDAYYGVFYLEGIAEVFGSQAIRYSYDDFSMLRQARCAALVLQPGSHKAFIDTRDGSSIDKDALSWCDVYAKINVDPAKLLGEAQDKVVAIGPSFGIRVWGITRAIRNAVGNYWKSRAAFNGYRNYREHFANYWRQYHYRLPLAAYVREPSYGNYVFSLSTLWKEEHARNCNEYRANFIMACRSLSNIQFEGGFAPRRPNDVRGFEALTADRRYPLNEYLAKLKRSLVAFNTPAVYGCHGWKLAEFLALGKAIISTPLSRSLPAPLEHGRHVHFVDGSFDEIKKAVRLLSEDTDYRHRLECNARNYFLEHLAPAKCIERIVHAMSERKHVPGGQ